jgi:hypothetical protein
MSKVDEGKNPIFVKRHENDTAPEYDVDEARMWPIAVGKKAETETTFAINK